MSYTSIKGGAVGALGGLLSPVDYGTGIEWASGLISAYPGTALQLGLWMVGSENDVANGNVDENIDRLIEFVQDMTFSHRLDDYNNDITEYDNDYDTTKRNHHHIHRKLTNDGYNDNSDLHRRRSPIHEDGSEQQDYQDMSFYIRIGYEFDNPENHYDPENYKLAFRRIVDRFKDVNLTNVAFVWHSYGGSLNENHTLYDWYPGYDYVDLCGVSIFKQPYECQTALKCEIPYIDEFAEICHAMNHPIMIAESTPFGGILEEKDAASSPTATNKAGITGSTWNRWFLPVLQYIEKHDIRIWSYINCNWDSQPLWAEAHAPGEQWGDSRIEMYPDLMQKWRSIVLASRRFAWSVNSVSNKVCAKESKHKQDDDDDDINSSDDNNNNFYHIVILGQIITLDPLVMGIIAVLLIAYIIRVVRKYQQRPSRWSFDVWHVLRSRRSYTIIN